MNPLSPGGHSAILAEFRRCNAPDQVRRCQRTAFPVRWFDRIGLTAEVPSDRPGGAAERARRESLPPRARIGAAARALQARSARAVRTFACRPARCGAPLSPRIRR